MQTEQLTKCLELVQVRARLGTRLTGLSPTPQEFYITDRAQAVLLMWFSMLSFYTVSHSVRLDDI